MHQEEQITAAMISAVAEDNFEASTIAAALLMIFTDLSPDVLKYVEMDPVRVGFNNSPEKFDNPPVAFGPPLNTSKG